jgi:hypothetical protein
MNTADSAECDKSSAWRRRMNPNEMELSSHDRPGYSAPTVTTMSEDQVLDQVGPAQAYTGNMPFGF